MTLHDQYRNFTIDQLLEAIENGAMPGSPHHEYLVKLLSVRTAEMVNRQLSETASTIGKSANLLKSTLDNSSDWLINAIKVSTETGDKSAQQIGDRIAGLAAALTTASGEIQSAGAQSAALGRRLNWLTGILTLAGLISAGATAFYAWETKRQVNLMEQQLQRMQVTAQPSTTAPPSVEH
jgi:hypothetical protein